MNKYKEKEKQKFLFNKKDQLIQYIQCLIDSYMVET